MAKNSVRLDIVYRSTYNTAMMQTRRKKRLYSTREPRLPLPSYKVAKKDKSFALRTLANADSRFAIVKELRRRLEQLKEDTGCVTLQREWMCARAVFLVARIESLEYDVVSGKRFRGETIWQLRR